MRAGTRGGPCLVLEPVLCGRGGLTLRMTGAVCQLQPHATARARWTIDPCLRSHHAHRRGRATGTSAAAANSSTARGREKNVV